MPELVHERTGFHGHGLTVGEHRRGASADDVESRFRRRYDAGGLRDDRTALLARERGRRRALVSDDGGPAAAAARPPHLGCAP